MKKFQKILQHDIFLNYLKEIVEVEQKREYCLHDLTHLLDVARYAYIKNLEEGYGLSQNVIYGAALLHDIGKVRQYKEKIPHEITGAEECGTVLQECGYTKEEIGKIKTAILHHRKGNDPKKNPLSELLYEADKKTRLCMYCRKKDTCNWKAEDKNQTIIY